MKPLRDIVLIKADPAELKTNSGLLLHENWKSLPLAGEVVEVGPAVVGIEPGSRVLFNRYASVILEEDLRLCKESQIIGVIDE